MDINTCTLTGHVRAITHGRTGKNDAACGFSLSVEGKLESLTFVRINVYGTLAEICKTKLIQNAKVVVLGELMNRVVDGKIRSSEDGKVRLTEVRGLSIDFCEQARLKEISDVETETGGS